MTTFDPALTPARTYGLAGLLPLLSMFVIGCDGDAPTSETPGKTRQGPLYALSTSVLTGDNAVSYVTVVDSLESGTSVALDDAIEFGGSARAYGPDNADVLYVTSSEAPTMTEIKFDESGAGRRGRVVSFMNLGLESTTGGNVNYHVSPTKAYFVSQDIAQIVVWNPKKMTYDKAVPLPMDTSPGAAGIVFYPRPIIVGDQLVLVATTYDDDDMPLGAVVNVVDTKTDTVVSSKLDTRCHDLLQSAVDANGDRYFGSSDYAAAMHFLVSKAPAPCMLRMRSGETAFDPDWSRTLTDDLGTLLWTGVTQGADGNLYVQSTDATTSAVKALDDAYEITIAQPWSWYSMASSDARPTPADVGIEFPPSFPPIPVDGNDYVTIYDDEDTTLVNLTSPGKPTSALAVPGFVFNVVRIR